MDTEPKLPPFYRIFEDGAHRFVLSHHAWDKCPVFETRKEAIDHALYLEGE